MVLTLDEPLSLAKTQKTQIKTSTKLIIKQHMYTERTTQWEVLLFLIITYKIMLLSTFELYTAWDGVILNDVNGEHLSRSGSVTS